MKKRLHLILNGIAAGALLVVLFGAWTSGLRRVDGAACGACTACDPGRDAVVVLTRVDGQPDAAWSAFDVAFDVTAHFPQGSLGLPGEAVTWVIALENHNAFAITDVMITDTLHDELEIVAVDVASGDVAISDRMLVYTLSELAPDDEVRIAVHTIVRRGPPNGLLQNQAVLAVNGPGGAMTRTVESDVFVPNGLPATGYPPADATLARARIPLPVLAAFAVGIIGLTAAYVYERGRR